MSSQASSIPAAIRDRTSASVQPHVWTPEDFADLGPRTAVDQALHRLVASKSLRRIARIETNFHPGLIWRGLTPTSRTYGASSFPQVLFVVARRNHFFGTKLAIQFGVILQESAPMHLLLEARDSARTVLDLVQSDLKRAGASSEFPLSSMSLKIAELIQHLPYQYGKGIALDVGTGSGVHALMLQQKINVCLPLIRTTRLLAWRSNAQFDWNSPQAFSQRRQGHPIFWFDDVPVACPTFAAFQPGGQNAHPPRPHHPPRQPHRRSHSRRHRRRPPPEAQQNPPPKPITRAALAQCLLQ